MKTKKTGTPTNARRRFSAAAIRTAQLGMSARRYRASQGGRKLTPRNRKRILDGMQRILEGTYAHLPLKRARYGFDPVQRIRILRTYESTLDDAAFNAEVNDILVGLRDMHTGYWRPHAGSKIAVLPFIVECYEDDAATGPRYLATKVGSAARGRGFEPGVVIETWNDVPIDLMVRRYGERECGGRPDSQRAMALSTLTHRPLFRYDLPDEEAVTIGFRAPARRGRAAGKRRYRRFEWRVIDTELVDRAQGDSARRRSGPGSRVMAINRVTAAVKKAKLLMHAPDAMQRERALPAEARAARPTKGTQSEVVDTKLAGGILRAAKVRGVDGEEYGYLRIFTFDVPRTRSFLVELARLLAELPQRGLIVDIRDNPGGVVVAAEMALQFFSPRPIQPVCFSWLATDFTRQYCELDFNAELQAPWLPSLRATIRNGESYSSAVPITDPAKSPIVDQVYGGPVVLVADATTYSSGDLFAAGFVDNALGPFLCVGDATGAGGACVCEYEDLAAELRGTALELPRMSAGAGMGFSWMRVTRTGPAQGTPIEDVGVPGFHRYRLTRADLMESNRDLLARCIDLLRKERRTDLRCAFRKRTGDLNVSSIGLDRIDVRVDGLALNSLRPDRAGNSHSSIRGRPVHIEVTGYHRQKLRQARSIRLR